MRIDWPSHLVMGTIAAACAWLFWATAHNIDPIGWFR